MLKTLTTTLLVTAAPLAVMAAPGTPVKTPIAEMPAGTYKEDDSHTSLIFMVDHMGLSHYTARFTDVDAELNLKPQDITKSTLKVTIDPKSIETHYPDMEKENFNQKLSDGKDWFNSNEYPEITFTSTKIEKTGENTGKVTGDLTMLGQTHPLTLDVTFNGAYESKPYANVPAVGFSATGVVKRSQWGFDTYVPNIGDDVKIAIETEMDMQP
tara:strand:- start:2 stop:637 length:636 start_codon:yes stop_codon:yes gene_type:complete